MAASDSMGRKEERAEERGRKYKNTKGGNWEGGKEGFSPIYKRKMAKSADISILYPYNLYLVVESN